MREKEPFRTVNRRAEHQPQLNVEAEEPNVSDKAQPSRLAT